MCQSCSLYLCQREELGQYLEEGLDQGHFVMVYPGNDLKYLRAVEETEDMEMEALCDPVRLNPGVQKPRNRDWPEA